MDGYGSTVNWGFSPAVDLAALYGTGPRTVRDHAEAALSPPSSSSSSSTDESFSALVVGASDGRHCLLTLSRAGRNGGDDPSMEFHVVEHNYESYCRQMLLFALVSEENSAVSIQDKTEMFLELYGNSLIRSSTSEYLTDVATRLIGVVTESPSAKPLPMFSLENLKFKERDILEAIFKFWRNTDVKYFNIAELWDGRLRAHYGVRYDHREGVIDWDLVMRLQPHAPILHSFEYRNWRQTGIAFEPREGDYNTPNRTLASGAIVNQAKRRGYWGDIVNSPFLPFGLASENATFFEKNNGKYIHNASEVTLWNVTAMISELHTGARYIDETTTNNEIPMAPATATGAKIDADDSDDGPRVVEVNDEEDSTTGDIPERKHVDGGLSNGMEKLSVCDRRGPIANVSNKIHLLPMDLFPTKITSKSKYQNKFHCMYLSNTMVHHLKTENITSLLKPGGIVVVETCKYMCQQKEEDITTYHKHVTKLAESIGLVADDVANASLPESRAHMVFRKPRVSDLK